MWQQRDHNEAEKKDADAEPVNNQGVSSYKRHRANLLAAGSGFGKKRLPQWVISRQICVYKTVDYKHVPRKDQDEALSLKVTQLSPFKQFGYSVAWADGVAMVWLWDAEIQAELMAQQGIADARIIPETLLQPQPEEPHADHASLRIVRCREGVDIQVWDGAVLSYSQCAGDDQFEPIVNQIKRTFSLPINAPPDIEDGSEWLNMPWGQQGSGEIVNAVDEWMPRAALLTFVVLMAWFVGGGWVWQNSEKDITDQMEALEGRIQSILVSRDQAIDARIQIDQLGELQLRLQGDLLLELQSLLPKDAHIKQFTYQHGSLVIEIQSAQQDPRHYVRTFQKEKHFSAIEVQPMGTKGLIRISMQVSS